MCSRPVRGYGIMDEYHICSDHDSHQAPSYFHYGEARDD